MLDIEQVIKALEGQWPQLAARAASCVLWQLARRGFEQRDDTPRIEPEASEPTVDDRDRDASKRRWRRQDWAALALRATSIGIKLVTVVGDLMNHMG
jgi:hypothetical protein